MLFHGVDYLSILCRYQSEDADKERKQQMNLHPMVAFGQKKAKTLGDEWQQKYHRAGKKPCREAEINTHRGEKRL